MNSTYYIFRQPNSIEELKALLALRYNTYMPSRLNRFIAENEMGLDLDCYDLYSCHFGFYEHTAESSRPVGYVRMVTDETGTFHDELFALAKSIPSLYTKVNRIPDVPLPVMKYCPYSDQIRQVHAELKSRGERLVEGSRLSLDASVRGLQLATNFIAALSACFIAHGASKAILACAQSHEAIYRRFGATGFNGSRSFYVDGAGICLLLLLLAPRGLPESMQERVLMMREAYEQTGSICYNPSDPHNYYEPVVPDRENEILSEAA